MRTDAIVDYRDDRVVVIRHDARDLPLDDDSVDLIVTSPPYFALRSYRDGGEHYSGQLGSEATPQEFVDNLSACMVEWWRVLKPSGSVWVNLGDKYAGSNGQSSGPSKLAGATYSPDGTRTKDAKKGGYVPTTDMRPKSLMGLPWRFAIAQIDAGWILRAEVIWSKPNGLPESVTDRVRRSHEQWFHFTKEPRYYSAVDEIREPANDSRPQRARAQELAEQLTDEQVAAARAVGVGDVGRGAAVQNGVNSVETYRLAAEAREVLGGYFREFLGGGLGRVPGSVWSVPTEPLIVPDAVRELRDLPDHFAAFPQEFPRRIILGWSPSGICTVCGEGRRPSTDKTPMEWTESPTIKGRTSTTRPASGTMHAAPTTTITGESCACPEPTAPTTPAIILDPFGGTGTVAGVAATLGRYGISNDLSEDYNRLAIWRITESGHFTKTEQRTWATRQGQML